MARERWKQEDWRIERNIEHENGRNKTETEIEATKFRVLARLTRGSFSELRTVTTRNRLAGMDERQLYSPSVACSSCV